MTLARAGVMHPEGIGRHGLFGLSSSIAPSWHWFEMLKGSRLTVTQKMASNTLLSISDEEVWIPKIGEQRVYNTPNIIYRIIVGLMSLYTKTKIEFRYVA